MVQRKALRIILSRLTGIGDRGFESNNVNISLYLSVHATVNNIMVCPDVLPDWAPHW